jgi:hypothetical protein
MAKPKTFKRFCVFRSLADVVSAIALTGGPTGIRLQRWGRRLHQLQAQLPEGIILMPLNEILNG